MKTAIFKAELDTPFGLFVIAVDSTKHDARIDIYNAASVEFPAPVGMVKIKGDVVKSTRRIVAKMNPVKKAQSNGKFWAWVTRAN